MSGTGAKLGGRTESNDGDPTSKMCDPCREKFRLLSDVQRPCDRPGCESTWTWTLQAQLEAFASRRPPPHHLCAEDEAKLAALADRQIPCSVSGCKRAWVFSRRAQLIAGAPDVEPVPEPAMCGPCANVYDKIGDRAVTCGIRGCKKKWTWPRDEQIQDYAAGESNEPPRRLCESCKGVFGAIAHREVRCRTSGCKNTWTWPREAQLDAAIADKPLPKAPHRMCQRCIDLYSSLRDVERPCRRPGCKRTWTDKRGAQLARAVRGKTGDPYPHYCAECEKEMGELEEQHVPCKTEHCPGTWTWTAAQQLAAGVRPVPKVEAPAVEARRSDDGDGNTHGRRRTDQHKPEHHKSAHELSDGVAGAISAAATSELQPEVDSSEGNGDNDGDNENDADIRADSTEDTAITTAGVPVVVTSPAASGPHLQSSGGGAGPDRKRRRRKRRREIRPPERRCEDCLAFLTDRKTKEVPCTGCKTPIHWPPESQLQTHLGNWAEPSLCGACKRDLTEAARVAEREALRHGGHLIDPGARESASPGGTSEVRAAAAEPGESSSENGGPVNSSDDVAAADSAPARSEEDKAPSSDAYP